MARRKSRVVRSDEVMVTLVLPRDLVSRIDLVRAEIARECERGVRPSRDQVVAESLTEWFDHADEGVNCEFLP